MLKPMMGPLSEFGPGCSGIAVWTPPGGGKEWIGIRVWIEAGSECSEDWAVVDEEVCVGFDDDDNDDNDDDETCWRFIKRLSWDAA